MPKLFFELNESQQDCFLSLKIVAERLECELGIYPKNEAGYSYLEIDTEKEGAKAILCLICMPFEIWDE